MSFHQIQGTPRLENPEILSDRMQVNASKLYKPPLPTTIPDLSTKNMDKKIDILLALAQGQNRSIYTLSQDMSRVVVDVNTIKETKTDHESIRYELEEANGKIARLEMKEESLCEKISVLEQKEHRKSVVFYNVKELGTQSTKNLIEFTYKFIKETLEIESENIFSKLNPSGEIRVDAIQRLGKPKTDTSKPRPILVQFLTVVGKELVYNSNTIAKLRQEESEIKMAEQYTPEIREKRTAQRPLFIGFKKQFKNSPTKVNLVKDKILINKEPIPSPFEENPLPGKTPLVLPYIQMTHSDTFTQNGSHFQGHIVKVCNLDQAAAAKNSIFQSYSNEHHIMYAYSVDAGDNKQLRGYDDDGEISGSLKLRGLMVREELTNIFLCVTRVKNGPNIGPIRFNLIDEAAKSAFDSYDNTIQPVFLTK